MLSETLATLAYFAEKNAVPIVSSELPEITLSSNLAFRNTRTQLESILRTTSRELSYNPSKISKTPYKFAKQLYPEIFLSKSDLYTVGLLEYFISNQFERSKDKFGFFGAEKHQGFKKVLLIQDGI